MVPIATSSTKTNRCVLFKGLDYEEDRALNLTTKPFKNLHLSKDHRIRSIVHKTNKLHLPSRAFLYVYRLKIKQSLVGKKCKPE
jgi:hypothetical protein